jgi:O-antigen ligase
MLRPKTPNLEIATDSVLLASCVLPFLIVLPLSQDIDMRASLLLLVGLVAIIIVVFYRKTYFPVFSKSAFYILSVFVAFTVVSLLMHPSAVDAVGTPLVRLGGLSLLACAVCGLLLTEVPTKKLMIWLYSTSLLIAVVSVPYNYLTLHYLMRLSGVFQQADTLAVWLACGFLIGLVIFPLYPLWRRQLYAGQAILLVVLLMTQTRAVIALLALILMIIILKSGYRTSRRYVMAGLILCVLVFLLGVGHLLSPNRLSDAGYASSSVQYRLSLQSYGLKASLHKPIWGYGYGNVTSALRCQSLHDPALQNTCSRGYYFDSSHDIYIDRILSIGYVGGLAYLLFVVRAIYSGLQKNGSEQYFAWAALLVSLYYLTNVTNIEVELLFWILISRAYKVTS